MRRRLIIPILSVCIFFSIIVLIIVNAFSVRIDYKFFSNIDEFSHLEQCDSEEIIEEDDYLRNSELLDSYTRRIEYKGKEYVVYAYVFVDVEDLREYFDKYTGKRTKSEWNFSSSSNYFFRSSFIAYHQNCLYRIEGGNYSDFVEAVNFITSEFSITYNSLKKK